MPLRRLNCVHLGEELAVLVEDLDAVVAAIGDEQPAPRIERERVRLLNSPGPGAELAPALDELAVLRELRDPRDRVGRAFAFWPLWPSATKMSPFGAVTTSFGSVSASGGLPATPALPSVSSTLPSGLNLIT